MLLNGLFGLLQTACDGIVCVFSIQVIEILLLTLKEDSFEQSAIAFSTTYVCFSTNSFFLSFKGYSTKEINGHGALGHI